MSTTSQSLPPATPTYILRGHASPIHGLHIFHHNLRLISGDANGWIVIWDLVTKRPVAVWKAHEGAILEVKAFGLSGSATEVYTHGRDHKLRVWKFRTQDEDLLQKTLPVDVSEDSEGTANQPWLVHSLPVNALNFCAFSMLFIDGLRAEKPDFQPQSSSQETPDSGPGETTRSSVLFAVPNALDSGALDIFHLPLERRICTIPTDPAVKTGMVMAANLFLGPSGELYVASAYEDGHVMVFARRGTFKEQDVHSKSSAWKWEKLYICRPHTQPALSIDAFPLGGYFLSSSADALVIKHPIPQLPSGHCNPDYTPLKTVNTKHAGQQGLRIRSDGKVFATAGWDCRVRVYSCKTMRELAVLRWHKEGCYAVAFADVATDSRASAVSGASTGDAQGEPHESQLTKQGGFSLTAIHQQRNSKAQNTHWLAAGSKDGKISLWDIY